MYALYQKQPEGSGYRYVFKEPVSLFGCKSGYIPKLLKPGLDRAVSEPLPWHLNIENAMNAIGQSGNALIINLKPKSAVPNLSLYEIIDVWGYCAAGWTPIMFFLRGLFIDDKSGAFDEKDFIRMPAEIAGPIFSMMYFSGTIKDGSISGKWTAPGPSSTNSVLLWPDTFRYFAEKAKEIYDHP